MGLSAYKSEGRVLCPAFCFGCGPLLTRLIQISCEALEFHGLFNRLHDGNLGKLVAGLDGDGVGGA